MATQDGKGLTFVACMILQTYVVCVFAQLFPCTTPSLRADEGNTQSYVSTITQGHDEETNSQIVHQDGENGM